ncbi:MAG: hypothetical protein OXP66_08905 [Candidatus Tectomicrobia bacterium]|nr:hypothetical protein [Candidatus Tectomicrobia bacterium]
MTRIVLLSTVPPCELLQIYPYVGLPAEYNSQQLRHGAACTHAWVNRRGLPSVGVRNGPAPITAPGDILAEGGYRVQIAQIPNGCLLAAVAFLAGAFATPEISAQPSNTELAIRALRTAGWKRLPGLVREVEYGISAIHAACPQFPKSAIAIALGEKYNTPWRRIEAEAAQSEMTTEEYARNIVYIVNNSVVDDLYRTNCR